MRTGLIIFAAAALASGTVAAPAMAAGQYYSNSYDGYYHGGDRWDRGDRHDRWDRHDRDWRRDQWRHEREREWRRHRHDRDYGYGYGHDYGW